MWNENSYIAYEIWQISVPGHVCRNSNRRLPFITFQPRKTNLCFPFPLAANKLRIAISVFRLQHTKEKCGFPLVLFCVCVCVFVFIFIMIFTLFVKKNIYLYFYLYMYMSTYAAVSNGNQKPRRFSFLIVQTEVSRLSVCWWGNKRKLSVCRRAKRTKQTKRTCYLWFSVYMYIYTENGTIHMCCRSNRKQKARRFSLIHLPFAHCETKVYHLSVGWRRNKRKLTVCKRTKRTGPPMQISTNTFIPCWGLW